MCISWCAVKFEGYLYGIEMLTLFIPKLKRRSVHRFVVLFAFKSYLTGSRWCGRMEQCIYTQRMHLHTKEWCSASTHIEMQQCIYTQMKHLHTKDAATQRMHLHTKERSSASTLIEMEQCIYTQRKHLHTKDAAAHKGMEQCIYTHRNGAVHLHAKEASTHKGMAQCIYTHGAQGRMEHLHKETHLKVCTSNCCSNDSHRSS
jgi:hypothetical protein